jgi:hypothetical protein
MILDSFNIKPEDCIIDAKIKKSVMRRFWDWLK